MAVCGDAASGVREGPMIVPEEQEEICSICGKRIPEEEEVRTKGGAAHEECAIRIYGEE